MSASDRERRLVLGVKHGGLGDHLQFSSIPEQAWRQKGIKSWLYSGSSFRNDEIREFVWHQNPYLVGETDSEPNAGSMCLEPTINFAGSWIGNWEYWHGLKPVSHVPQLYGSALKSDEAKDCVIVDLTAITLARVHSSFAYSEDRVVEVVQKMRDEMPDKQFLQVSFTKTLNRSGSSMQIVVPDMPVFRVLSLHQYAAAIRGASGVVGLYSGVVALASGLYGLELPARISCLAATEFLFHPRQQVDLVHLYPNVNYYAV